MISKMGRGHDRTLSCQGKKNDGKLVRSTKKLERIERVELYVVRNGIKFTLKKVRGANKRMHRNGTASFICDEIQSESY